MSFPPLPRLSPIGTDLFPPERHRLLDRCGSTNDVARDLALSGEPEGTLVLADAQDAGRGRLGRAWYSPPGVNVYLSMVLRPRIDPDTIPLLTLVLAVAAVDAVCDRGVAASLKWPNDLIVTGQRRRKLAGIACEAIGGGPIAVAAGLGVNVNLRDEDLSDDLRPIATSMRIESGRHHERAALVGGILDHFASLYARLQRDGPDGILPLYTRRLETLGRPVSVDLGSRSIVGKAVGIGGRGELRVRCDDGRVETVTAGDVGME